MFVKRESINIKGSLAGVSGATTLLRRCTEIQAKAQGIFQGTNSERLPKQKRLLFETVPFDSLSWMKTFCTAVLMTGLLGVYSTVTHAHGLLHDFLTNILGR